MKETVSGNRSHTRPFPRWVMVTVSLALLAVLFLPPGPAGADTAAIVRHGPTDRPKIALTFDDNYNVSRALAVIDVLKRYDVDATMFVYGYAVTAYPSIAHAIAEGGFEVGDHSLSHSLLTGLSWTSLLREIGGGTSAYRTATGHRTVPLFR